MVRKEGSRTVARVILEHQGTQVELASPVTSTESVQLSGGPLTLIEDPVGLWVLAYTLLGERELVAQLRDALIATTRWCRCVSRRCCCWSCTIFIDMWFFMLLLLLQLILMLVLILILAVLQGRQHIERVQMRHRATTIVPQRVALGIERQQLARQPQTLKVVCIGAPLAVGRRVSLVCIVGRQHSLQQGTLALQASSKRAYCATRFAVCSFFSRSASAVPLNFLTPCIR